MKESKIQKKIIEELRERGAYVIKVMKSSRSGVPDLVCCYEGCFIAIEVKNDSGEASPLQEFNIKKIRGAGGKAVVMRGVNDIKKILK